MAQGIENPNERARGWCFTRQVKLEEIDEEFHKYLDGIENIKCAAWQMEKAPETNQLHIQGWVSFKNARTFRIVKSLLEGNPHLEKQRGTDEQCWAYCTKLETRVVGPWTIGEPGKQGKRSDLEAIAVSARAGKKISEFSPFEIARYSRQIMAVRLFMPPPVRTEVKVYTILGTSGLGKSFIVYGNDAKLGGVYPPIYTENPHKLWFDGYDGEKTLLLDEFCGQISSTLLNAICDPYKMRVQVKAGSTWAAWDRVIICSNVSPDNWYPTLQPQLFAPVLRRIKKTPDGYMKPEGATVDEGRKDLQRLWDKAFDVLPAIAPPRVPEVVIVPPCGTPEPEPVPALGTPCNTPYLTEDESDDESEPSLKRRNAMVIDN